MQTWLRPNRRVLFIAGVAWTVALCCGLSLIRTSDKQPMTLFGWMVGALGAIGIARNVWSALQPRVGYANQELLLYLQGGTPVRLPIDVIECFFLGQGPSGIRQRDAGSDLESQNVVVRLAERATEWHHGHVQRGLGHWCDGYITITGTWCEPITADVVGLMNHELAKVKRKRKAETQTTAHPSMGREA